MALTKNITDIVVRDFSPKWKNLTLGWMAGVDLSGLKEKFIEKKLEEVGDITIDRVLVGYEGSIKTMHKQVKIETYRTLKSWAAISGSVAGSPTALYQSQYALADALNIHPVDMAADLSEDFNFIKAYPSVELPKSAEGKAFVPLTIEWFIYPDVDKLTAEPPVLEYFWIGAPDARPT